MANAREMLRVLLRAAAQPRRSARAVAGVEETARAQTLVASWRGQVAAPAAEPVANPLRSFFDARREGRGIWKWLHYFDVYQRHLQKFAGTDAHLVEIGVYSGGSLDMWRDYLGPAATITGIDIAPECRVYETGATKIAIGDQADRAFWASFRAANPRVDVLIDDGGHQPEQQMVTVEEMLPHLQPGGVYICEDVHGRGGRFARFAHALADALNESQRADGEAGAGVPRYRATEFQAAVAGIHFYPYMVVIERTTSPRAEFKAPKHGTEWQPFFD